MARSLVTAVMLGVGMLGTALSSGAVEARELDGAQVYQDNCGRCHQPRTPADLSADGWRAVSFHMRVKGNLTPSEFYALEDFLIPESPPLAAEGPPTLLDAAPVAARLCATCHDAQRIEDAVASGRTEEQWQATLARMRTYGAALSSDEADELAAWLSSPTVEKKP